MAVRWSLRSFAVPCPESPLQRSSQPSKPRVEIRCTRWTCPIGCFYARRVLVCTASDACSTFTGKLPKLSMEPVLRRIPDCLRRHSRAQMRVAFVSACSRCNLKCEFTESRQSANRLPRCAIARQHAPSLRAASSTVASPFIDARKLVPSRAHANMHATIGAAEILRSGNSLPRRAIALGHSPRPCARSRKHRRPRLSMVENRSRRAPLPICVIKL
jgi:hypothetical protein